MRINTLYFVRHGESEANAGIANQPNHEIILTATGQSQAQQLVERLDIQPATVYTSELLRTQQTAAYFCRKHGIEHQVLPLLNEMCCLDYENIKDISIENRRQLAKEYWNRADLHEKNGPAADSFVMFVNRVREFLASYQQYPDHTVFFGHGMWIGLLAWHLMGFSIEDSNSMRLFRQFQTAMVMDNTVVYQLQWDEASGLQQFNLYSRLRNTHS